VEVREQQEHAGQESLAEGATVRVLQPTGREAVFGLVEVEAEVQWHGPPGELRLLLDGELVATAQGSSLRQAVDVGQQNRSHRFEVVAVTEDGRQSRGGVETPAIPVDEVVDLELLQVFATVTDRRGRRVLNLDRSAFELREDGQGQRIVTLESGDIPFTAVVLVDGSSSMTEVQRQGARRGVRALAEGMHPFDEVKLLAFDHRILAESPFTQDPAVLEAALPELRSRGGTALLDHLFVAHRALDERLGRKVILLLSDGAEVHSVLRLRQIEEMLRDSWVQIFWLELPKPGSDEGLLYNSFLPPKEIQERHRRLRRTVEETGGRVLTATTPEEIEAAFAEVLRELREQYALGYYPPKGAQAGSWRDLSLKVRGAGLKVRTRKGYRVLR
jgi:Ca-activated chloride channel family protein